MTTLPDISSYFSGNYTTSVSLANADDRYNTRASSSQSDDDAYFSGLMKSLDESNDSKETRKSEKAPDDTDKKDSSDESESSSADVSTSNEADTSQQNQTGVAFVDGEQGQKSDAPQSDETDLSDLGLTPEDSPPLYTLSAPPSFITTIASDKSMANSFVFDGDMEAMSLSADMTALGEIENIKNVNSGFKDALTGLSAALQALFDGLNGEDSVMSSSDLPKTENATGVEGEDKSSLFALLGALIEHIGEQGNEAEVGVGAGETSPLEEGQSVVQNVLSALQSGEYTDLEDVLSDLSATDLAALKEQVFTYLDSGMLNTDTQDEITGLMAKYTPAATNESNKAEGNVPDGGETAASSNSRESANTTGDQDTADSFSKATQSTQESSTAQNSENPQNLKANETMASLSAGARFLQSTAAASGDPLSTLTGTNSDSASILQGVSTLQMQNNSSSVTTSALGTSGTGTQAHPATQMVSMTIQKALKNGEETTIKLQLDPPELGRVEVKMSIDQNSAATIVLTAEKAETHQMLQRDSQFLEQAMSDAGLDTQGNLSFEMADDGQAFGQNNDTSDSTLSSHASTQNENGSSLEQDIVAQSNTSQWYVDPGTGHMRYNILT